MAATAVRSKLSVVQIARTVAAATACAAVLHPGNRGPMAVIACDFSMCTCQCKCCLRIVIECPHVPADRVMARVTLLVEVASVWIIVLMTGNTGGVVATERLGFVTVRALCFAVVTQ